MSFKGAKLYAAAAKSNGAPNEAQLAAIRQYALSDLAPESVYVRTFALAHNCIDRDDEVFDEGLLADFAKTLPGKGIYIKHPNSWQGDGGPAEGRWFGATLQTMSLADAQSMLREPTLTLPPDRNTVTVLMADGYLVRTPDNATLIAKIDGGVAGDVSIGFCAQTKVPIKDAQGRELQAQRILGPGEALEGSLVWLGAQPGARAIKSAQQHANSHEDNAMNEAEFKAKLADAEVAAKALQKHADFHSTLKAALGTDHAAIADDPATVASLAIAGKAAREAMIDDIVADARAKGALGDTPEEIAAAKSAYAAMQPAQLKTLHAIAQKSAPTKPVIGGGDPNVNQNKAAAMPAGSLFANPLIAA